jgi:hypothetical protein
MDNKIYIDDEGTELSINAGSDISTADILQIKVIKPNKTTDTWDCTVDENNNNIVNYIIQHGDLDQKGEYKLQLYIEIEEWKGLGETTSFKVYEKFS